MIDIQDTVQTIYRLALYDPRVDKYRKPAAHHPQLVQQIYAKVHEYAIDQLMSVANAIGPETEEERAVVAWLQQKLVAIAQQLPTPKEDHNAE